jgi:hypothetical protein
MSKVCPLSHQAAYDIMFEAFLERCCDLMERERLLDPTKCRRGLAVLDPDDPDADIPF